VSTATNTPDVSAPLAPLYEVPTLSNSALVALALLLLGIATAFLIRNRQ